METRLKTIWKRTNILLLLLFLLPACEKEQKRMDDYLVEFATVVHENSNRRFRLDNGRLLVPENGNNYAGEEGQRVVINYTPLDGDVIKVNAVSNIFTGAVRTDGFSERYPNDPVKIRSVWVGGDYLNLVMEVEYHNAPHSIALFRNPAATTVDLHFSHSSNNDSPGYPTMLYASFLLADLKEQATPVPFRLFINTYAGMRIIDLRLL
jgi:hypothetical protein